MSDVVRFPRKGSSISHSSLLGGAKDPETVIVTANEEGGYDVHVYLGCRLAHADALELAVKASGRFGVARIEDVSEFGPPPINDDFGGAA